MRLQSVVTANLNETWPRVISVQWITREEAPERGIVRAHAHPIEARLAIVADAISVTVTVEIGPGLPAQALGGGCQLTKGVVGIAGNWIASGIDQRHHITMAVVDVVVARGRIRIAARLDAHLDVAGVIGEGGEHGPTLVGLVGEMPQHIDIVDAVAHPAAGSGFAGPVIIGVISKTGSLCRSAGRSRSACESLADANETRYATVWASWSAHNRFRAQAMAASQAPAGALCMGIEEEQL